MGRCLGLLGFGTEYALDMEELPHVADAPVAQASVSNISSDNANGAGTPVPPSPTEGEPRISRDQARELKKLAQSAFGFIAGEQQLREDLGLEADKALTLMRLQAHVNPAHYAALMADYEAAPRQAMAQDVVDHVPPVVYPRIMSTDLDV